MMYTTDSLRITKISDDEYIVAIYANLHFVNNLTYRDYVNELNNWAKSEGVFMWPGCYGVVTKAQLTYIMLQIPKEISFSYQ